MRPSGQAARGALSGVIAGAGAWTAHALSGGDVAPLAGTAVLLASVAAGRFLAVGGDPRRTVALALGAQGLWHLVFMASTHAAGPAPGSSDGDATLTMLGAHGLVAALSAALAVGLDRALVSATARLAATLVPRLIVRVWRAVVVETPSPLSTEPVGPRPTAPFLVVRVLRGPPLPTTSALG
jgi:hypothetical protein